MKNKIVGITLGVIILGLIITCVCILIIKNSGKYGTYNLASIICS